MFCLPCKLLLPCGVCASNRLVKVHGFWPFYKQPDMALMIRGVSLFKANSSVLPEYKEIDPAAAHVQATVEAGYLVAQAVLYVCVLYFMAGFDRTAGELNTLSPHCKS